MLPWRGNRFAEYSLAPPDHREVRGEYVLLIWGEAPYWIVVDREMAGFLDCLQASTWDAAVRGTPQAKSHRKLIDETIQKLKSAGVYRSPDEKRKPPLSERIESIGINLTRRCNLRCGFCYNVDTPGERAAGELSAGQFIAFLREIRPLRSRRAALIILGGEPLLESEKLLAVAEEGRRQRLDTIVSTNGTHITPDFARRAAAARLQVQVSLDAVTAEPHDRLRGTGVFDRAMAGIRLLVEQGAHTILSMVVHRGNLDSLAEYYAMARDLGVKEARFIPLKTIGGGGHCGLTAVPLAELIQRAFILFRDHSEYRPLMGRDAFSILASTCRYSSPRTSCGTGLQTILLDADGSLYPCLNLNRPDLRIANIRDEGYRLDRVWRTSPILQKVRWCSAVTTPGRVCSGCVVRHWCLGGCRGEALARGRKLDGPPPNCQDLRSAVLEMMWILCQAPDLAKPAPPVC